MANLKEILFFEKIGFLNHRGFSKITGSLVFIFAEICLQYNHTALGNKLLPFDFNQCQTQGFFDSPK